MNPKDSLLGRGCGGILNLGLRPSTATRLGERERRPCEGRYFGNTSSTQGATQCSRPYGHKVVIQARCNREGGRYLGVSPDKGEACEPGVVCP